MERRFYDRQNEMKELKTKFDSISKGEFGVIYGRRRTGKSELLRQFYGNVTNTDKIFLTITSTNRNDLKAVLGESIKKSTGEEVKIERWDDFFDFILERSESKRVLIILDEFQRLNNFAKDFYFSLQEAWDAKLKYAKVMLLICGSSMSMMHRIALEEHGPLYGRKTFEIQVSPFKYMD